jgi:hypothetical protein
LSFERDDKHAGDTTVVEREVKPQIYKVGTTWILWVPGVRVYRFEDWQSAVQHALDPSSRQQPRVSSRFAKA